MRISPKLVYFFIIHFKVEEMQVKKYFIEFFVFVFYDDVKKIDL